MSKWLKNIFLANWQRKGVAIVAAAVIWLLVNHSITITKTYTGVPIRVINIPSNKTIEGLLPNDLLRKKVTLTLKGRRNPLEQLQPNDLLIVIDAAGKGDRWTTDVTRKNLVSQDPGIDIKDGVQGMGPFPLTFELESVITDKIPVVITEPIGEPPTGYLFLDVWPQRLFQTVTGPETRVLELKSEGLKLTFNLDKISQEDLEKEATAAQLEGQDEIRFPLPESWKRIGIPSIAEGLVELNDPLASFLQIDFLKKELLPLETDLPIALFYPVPYQNFLNPETLKLTDSKWVTTRAGLHLLTLPLFIRNTSRIFLETVRNFLEITFIVVPPNVLKNLPWSLQFIDPMGLEEAYLRASTTNISEAEKLTSPTLHEEYLRSRFRQYMRRFELVKADGVALDLEAKLSAGAIKIEEASSE